MLYFGKRVKELRKSAKLTQADLAERLMVSVQTISKWETGNAMPDISQIVPLAALLGVTTDYLLGVTGNEKADREQLIREVEEINKGIERVYDRKDDPYHACYLLYRDYIRKYPLDFEMKFRCADSMIRCLYYSKISEEEKEKLYGEAVNLLESILHCDEDITRVIDARQLLVILYLYQNDFVNAEETARTLPQKGSVRTAMEIEIASKKNDQAKCLELAESACLEAVHHYLWALAVRARRISLFGTERKREAIDAWQSLIEAAKTNDTAFRDMTIHTKWLYSAYNHLSNDYLALSEKEEALDVVETLAKTILDDYRVCKDRGENATAEELRKNYEFYLKGCCQQETTDGGSIFENTRFLACIAMRERMIQ